MNSTGTKDVVDAFETFTRIRGRPTYVLSDNAPCFQEADSIFQQAVRTSLNSKFAETTWAFIPTYSPWWGGQYEIFVRLMKTFLVKYLPEMRITDQLHGVRVLKAAEWCINSRPLYAVPRGINDVGVITPMHFLRVGFKLDEKYSPANVDLPLSVYSKMICNQSLQIQEMWKQLHQEYLSSLRAFHMKRGCFSKRLIKVGDIVLMKNDGFSRNFWPLAIVVKLFPSNDGAIRSVRVKKYAPYAINATLRRKLYKTNSNQGLTPNQIKELTGYFIGQKNPVEVRNLVPFELWKGDQAEPEDMDVGQVGSITVSLHDGKIKGSVHAFWDVSKIQREQQNSPCLVHFQGSQLSGSDKAFWAMGYKNKPQSEIEMFDELPSHLVTKPEDIWMGDEEDEEIHEDVLAFWECYPDPR
jgi:hypothetical protein